MKHSHIIVSILISLSMLTPLNASAQPLQTPSQIETAQADKVIGKATVASTRLNVKISPHKNSDIALSLHYQQNVEICSVLEKNWYKIKVGSTTGYVKGNFLTDINVTDPTVQPIEEDIFLKYGEDSNVIATTKFNVNIRKNNGRQYERIGVIPKGEKITIIKRFKNDWVKIEYKSKVGYLDSKCLENISTEEHNNKAPQKPKPTSANLSGEEFFAVSNLETLLTVHTRPSFESEALEILNVGTRIILLEQMDDDWYKIKYENSHAFVYGKELNFEMQSTDELYMSEKIITLYENVSFRLKAYDLLAYDNEEILWSSEDTNIAAVTENGLLTAKSEGNVRINAVSKSGGKRTSCIVFVTPIISSALIPGVPMYNQMEEGYPTGCEQFSSKILLSHYGFNVSNEEIIDAIGLSPIPYRQNGTIFGGDPTESFIGIPTQRKPLGYGCLPSAIVRGINIYLDNIGADFSAYDISGCKIETIYAYLDQGIPLIAASAYLPSKYDARIIKAWTWNANQGTNKGQQFSWWSSRHVMVLIGYDENYIYSVDPCFNTVQAFVKKDWIADWVNVGRQTVVMLED